MTGGPTARRMRSITVMPTTQTILDSIEKRLRDINAEIETLTAARSALDGDQARPPRRASKPAAASSAARRPRGSTGRPRRTKPVEVVPAGRLESLLGESDGLTTSALVEQTNGDRDQVLTLLRELEANGKVRRTGQRRSTRWHAITDEDRIRERAAELAARSKRAAALVAGSKRAA